ncbi:MAG: caspase family protein [Acidimicrobiia bacterium]
MTLSTLESGADAAAPARAEVAAARTTRSPAPVAAPVPAPPAVAEPPAPVDPATAPPAPLELVTEPVVAPPARPLSVAPAPPRGSTFADRHPAQAAATQDPADPATTRWALLIGINDHMGRVSDNIGSRQDAEDLRAHLLASGWRDDHILLLTDRAATRTAIVEGLRWLADKTDPSSTAVFHYSGHSKKWYGQDHDGDGEITDEGLWPTDDRFIPDSELVRLLDPLDASTAWISFATCNAAGFADHGLARPGRVLTFSSGEHQKSYEHPSWDNSVWGFLMIDQAMRAGAGDADGDGRVSVEEAWTWARPQASHTTSRQRHGPQDAVIVDDLDGELHLAVPGAPAPAPSPSPAPAADPAPDQPPPPEGDATPAPDERDRERHGGYLCVLCG